MVNFIICLFFDGLCAQMAMSAVAVQLTRQAIKLGQQGTRHLLYVQFHFQPRIVINTSLPHQRTRFTAPCLSSSKAQLVSTGSSAQKHASSDPEFRNIYIFRYIVHVRVLSRLKIYQTLLTVGTIPPGVYLHNAGDLSTSGLAAFVGIASLATAMLYVMSAFFRHIVGIISVNQSENVVRISHLSFWGKRCDVQFNLSDIVPLSDMPVKPNDIYQVIQFYEKPFRFYWFLRHGKHTDAEAIQRLFGKI